MPTPARRAEDAAQHQSWMTVMLPVELHDAVRVIAAELDMSVSAFVRRSLKREVNRNQKRASNIP